MNLKTYFGGIKNAIFNSVSADHIKLVGIANIISAGLFFLTGVFIARKLGPTAYGTVTLIFSFPNLIFSILNAKSSDVAIKYLGEFHSQAKWHRASSMCQLNYLVDFAIAIASLAVIFFTVGIAEKHILHAEGYRGLMILYATSFFAQALSNTSYAILSVLGNFKAISAMIILNPLLRCILIILFLLLGFGLKSIIWGHVIAVFVYGVSYFIIATRLVLINWGKATWRDFWEGLKGKRREIVKFLVYNDLDALFSTAAKQLDNIVLGYFRNATEVGYYHLARSFSSVLGYIVAPIQTVAYPRLALLIGEKKFENVRIIIRKIILYTGIPTSISIIPVIFLMGWLVPLIAGVAYKPAILTCQILMASTMIWTILHWLKPVFLAYGQIKTVMFLNLLISIATLIGFLFMTYWNGHVGMASWLFVMAFVGHLAFLFVYLREHKKWQMI